MACVNKVIIVGRLGQDPQVRTFNNGGKIVDLSIATSETWKDKTTGEKKQRTEWHTVSILNEAIANVAEKYLSKGSQVYIEGSLETQKWQDKTGADRYTTKIVLRPYNGALTLLGDARGGNEGSPKAYDQSPDPQASQGAAQNYLDDEIPF